MRSQNGFNVIAIDKQTGEIIQTCCKVYKNRASLIKRLNQSQNIQVKVVDAVTGLDWADFSAKL